jgi:hypothetical protein
MQVEREKKSTENLMDGWMTGVEHGAVFVPRASVPTVRTIKERIA